MNELLAIVLIVLLCCAMFFAWLFALATCPDRLVNLISGTKSSSSPISRASEDNGTRKGSSACVSEAGGASPPAAQSLLAAVVKRASPASQRDMRPLLGRSRSIPNSRNNGTAVSAPPPAIGSEKRSTSKKLSVVPEADEQLTVTSLSQCGAVRTSAGGARTPTSPKNASGIAEEGLVVRTVQLTRHHSECVAKCVDEAEEGEEEGRREERRLTAEHRAMSAEEQRELYNDGPPTTTTTASGGASFEEVDEASDDGDDARHRPQRMAMRRSAPPAIHIA
ncbi:hypothetical protein niasHT_037951 [Heterodera trifolii]|uniref:Membrane-associated protein n=1 Tax=Heterodera trifolii TaxID=157864 RepID=A0ABD2HSW4_9BILA